MISSDSCLSSHDDKSEEAVEISDEIELNIENRSNSSTQKIDSTIHNLSHSLNDFPQTQVQIQSRNNTLDAITEIPQNDNNNDHLNINDNDKVTVNEIQSSIFAQIAHISEFLANAEENFPNKKSNPCLQILSDFFEVFNEQLRINFKIRNKLNEERRKNPIDPRKVEEKKKEIECFLKEFKGIVSSSTNNYSSLINTANIDQSFNNVIKIIQKGIKKTVKLKKLAKEIENKQKEIANINSEIILSEKKLQDIKNNTEDRSNSIQKQIDQSQDQISKIQTQIEEISPNISSMKNKIQNEARMRQNLSEMIAKRKNQIEIARQSFCEEQNKQRQKRQKLGVKLSKLKIERRQLLIDEQPLFSALKEAEDELEICKKQADSNLISISEKKNEIEKQLEDLKLQLIESQKKKEDKTSILQQKKEEANKISIDILEINEKIKTLKKNIFQIGEKKKSILFELNQKNTNTQNKDQKNFNKAQKNHDQDYSDKSDFNEKDHTSKRNNLINSNSRDIDDLILNSLSEELMRLEDLTSQCNAQIENIRKNNNKTRSMIRVNKDKISKLIDENQKLNATILINQKEVEKLIIDANAQKQKYALFKLTMNEYNRMRTALGFHSAMLPSEVAKHTVAMIRSWKQVEFDEERHLNEKISYNSINEEFKYIFGEINDVESKLYGTSQ